MASIPFTIFAIIAFFQLTAWGNEWNEKKELVDSGKIQPIEAEIIKKEKRTSIERVSNSKRVKTSYIVVLQIQEKEKIQRSIGLETWKALKENQILEAYPIEDEYFIPSTDIGGHMKYRWIALGLGLSPLTMGGAIYTLRKTLMKA
tara:strand:- start:88 stop:525 length:438 start_codon:yes stop_codon:yes gene_type:complete